MIGVGTVYIQVAPSFRGWNSSVTRELNKATPTAATAGTAASQSFGSKFTSGLGRAAKVGGIALAGAATYGAVQFASNAVSLEQQYGKTMNQLQANTGAPKQAMRDLSDLALQMGADTVFSASDASNAMLELAKSGMSPATIQAGALEEALTLAAAGGLDMESAASVMGNTLNAFNLKGKESAQVSAALAGAANSSSASVSSLAEGLQQVSAGANDTGFTVQETTGALAALANAGISGSDAGTTLKTMFTRLIPSTKAARTEFSRLGLSAYQSKGSMDELAELGIEPLSGKFHDVYKAIGDYVVQTGQADRGTAEFDKKTSDLLYSTGLMQNAFVKQNGEFKSMTKVTGILDKTFGDMSASERAASMNTLFGSDARRAATILTNEGSKGLAKYVKASSDQTAAEKQAAAAMKGTAGAVESMKGSVETASLTFGMAIKPLTIFGAGIVTQIANRAVPIIQDLGGHLRNLIRNGPSVEELGHKIGQAFSSVDWSSLRDAIADIDWSAFKSIDLSGFKDAGKELPTFSDGLHVAGVVLRFAADHADLLAESLPYLAAGFLLVKTAQAAQQVYQIASVPLDIAKLVTQRQLVGAMKAHTVAMGTSTTAIGVNTTAEGVSIGAKKAGILTTIRSRVATVARTVAEKAAAVASKAFAAGQWLVNAALRANPIGIVITLLTLLGGALYLAWTKSSRFREIVDAAWAGIKSAASASWDFIRGVFSALTGWLTKTLPAGWTKLKTAVGDVWDGIKTSVSNALGFLKNLFLNWTGPGLVIKHWDAIKTTIRDAWVSIKTGVSNALITVKTSLGDAWAVVKTGVTTAWDWVKTKIRDTWTGIKTTLGGVKSFLVDTVVGAFDSAASGIGRVWDKIKGYASAPINFVIDTVYNNGIRAAFNSITDFLGISLSLPYASPIGGGGSSSLSSDNLRTFVGSGSQHGLARGGVVPGADPGRRDNVLMPMRSGEGVLVPELTGMLGKARIDAWNRAAEAGKNPLVYSGIGGLFGWVKEQVVDRSLDYVTDKLRDAVAGLTGSLGDSGFGQMVTAVPMRLVDGMVDYFAEKLGISGDDPLQAPPTGSTASYSGPLLPGAWVKPLTDYVVTSGFPAYADGSYHSGIDLAGPAGTRVGSAHAGRVVASYDIPGTNPYDNDGYASLGRVVEVAHGGGLSTKYAHLLRRMVQVGQDLLAGAVLGLRGSMGNSSGDHLHFETLVNGTAVQPQGFQGLTFDTGGMLPKGVSTVYNGTGGPEAVLTTEQWRHIKALIAKTFVGHSPSTITSDFVAGQLSRAPATPQQLKTRYSDALAVYRRQLEQTAAASQRLSAAEDRATNIAKAITGREKTLTQLGAELDKLRSVKELGDLIAEQRKKDQPNQQRIDALRDELRQRDRLARRIGSVRDILGKQRDTERDINQIVRLRTRDLEAQSRQSDRAGEAARRVADAYAAAQQAAVDQAAGVRDNVLGLGGDLLGGDGFTDVASVKARLQRALGVAHAFRRVLGRLIRAGLRGPLLQQFIDANGSPAALVFGRDLLAHQGQLKSLLRLQDQLADVAVSAGARAAAGPRDPRSPRTPPRPPRLHRPRGATSVNVRSATSVNGERDAHAGRDVTVTQNIYEAQRMDERQLANYTAGKLTKALRP